MHMPCSQNILRVFSATARYLQQALRGSGANFKVSKHISLRQRAAKFPNSDGQILRRPKIQYHSFESLPSLPVSIEPLLLFLLYTRQPLYAPSILPNRDP